MNSGDVISRYRLGARIGKGAMGLVYRAEDTRLQRPVALKFLPNDSLTTQRKERFLNEARAAAMARHPNICPIYDIEEADGELFIAMAYIDGQTLQQRIAHGPIDPGRAVEIAFSIASGLASAHALGVVHRDIKSSNIMIDSQGHVSIMDFGIALFPDAVRMTQEGSAIGTPAYMSPEQAQGRELDARTDIWSLGVVMFEMLTGRLPFEAEYRAGLIHAIINEPAPSVASLQRGVPPGVEAIVTKALTKHPADRWKSAAAMAAELRRLLTGGSISSSERVATETLAIPASPQRFSKRARRFGGIAVAVVVLAAGSYGAFRYKFERPAAVSGTAVGALKQVAIFPFQVEGVVGSVSTIADGLSEILTASFSDIERFEGKITAVPASEVRRRKITTPAEARRFFGVNLVLTGVAKAVVRGEKPAEDDNVEFTVNLIDAITTKQIATRTFLYDPKNPLVSRDQAVTQVVRMLNLDVPAAARMAMTKGDTAAPSAYSAYIEGRGFLSRHDVSGNVDRAIVSFTHATKQDPKFALAYAGLGEAYWWKANSTGDKQWSTLANQNAEYAVQLDGSLAPVHSVLGAVYLDAGRPQDAIREYERAMELAPSNAEAPRQLAEVYRTMGKFPEAEELYKRSIRLRPTDWYGHLLLGLFYLGRQRYSESEAAFLSARELTPDNDTVRLDLGAVYRAHGRYKEAVEEFQQALRIRSDALTYASLGGAYFMEHRFAEAVAAVEAAIDLDSTDYRLWGNLGAYYRWTPGNEPKSAPALRRAIEQATKFAETRKSDFNIRANLAEYRARLGDRKGALEEIGRIPESVRGTYTSRIALVYELSGQRDRAIDIIRANMKTPDSLKYYRDNPDFAAVWREGKFQ